jgi:hypothetical protein
MMATKTGIAAAVHGSSIRASASTGRLKPGSAAPERLQVELPPAVDVHHTDVLDRMSCDGSRAIGDAIGRVLRPVVHRPPPPAVRNATPLSLDTIAPPLLHCRTSFPGREVEMALSSDGQSNRRRGASAYRRLVRCRRRAKVAPVLIVIAALSLSACGGSSSKSSVASGTLKSPGLYGKLPPAGTPSQGGTISFGLLNGNTPNYIFPVTPSGNGSTYNYYWQQIMYLPL